MLFLSYLLIRTWILSAQQINKNYPTYLINLQQLTKIQVMNKFISNHLYI